MVTIYVYLVQVETVGNLIFELQEILLCKLNFIQ
jgi:hypothetical protein